MTRAALAIVLTALSLPAQAPRERIARGIAAYQALDFRSSVEFLRAGLSSTWAARLPDSLRVTALGYLGAAEYLSGHIVAAEDSFREALERVPTFRLDTLVFPPLLTDAFEVLRAGTLFVTVTVVEDSMTFRAGWTRTFVLRASAPHRVIVVAEFADGRPWTSLYDGPIRDSLVVRWYEPDDAGETSPLSLTIEVLSLSPAGGSRRVRVPVVVDRSRRFASYTGASSRTGSIGCSPSISRIQEAKRGMPISIVTRGE